MRCAMCGEDGGRGRSVGGVWLEMGVVEGSLTPLLYFILLCFTYHFSILFYFTFLLHSALLCSTLHISTRGGGKAGSGKFLVRSF